jgi:hypothetical protein
LIASVVKVAGRTSSNRDTLTAWLGDLLAYGGDRYRGQITEYARAAGLAPGTLRDAKLVCSRIPVSCRHDTLSWAHHCEVGRAFKDPAEIAKWLGVAEKGANSKAELRRMIRCHLAKTRPDMRDAGSNRIVNGPFTLLRELRAAGRFVRNHAGTWADWTPTACELALADVAPIVEFIAQLRTRADGKRNQTPAR